MSTIKDCASDTVRQRDLQVQLWAGVALCWGRAWTAVKTLMEARIVGIDIASVEMRFKVGGKSRGAVMWRHCEERLPRRYIYTCPRMCCYRLGNRLGNEGSRHQACCASPIRCAHRDDAMIHRKGVGEGVVELHSGAFVGFRPRGSQGILRAGPVTSSSQQISSLPCTSNEETTFILLCTILTLQRGRLLSTVLDTRYDVVNHQLRRNHHLGLADQVNGYAVRTYHSSIWIVNPKLGLRSRW
jgi:hypothetical protein